MEPEQFAGDRIAAEVGRTEQPIPSQLASGQAGLSNKRIRQRDSTIAVVLVVLPPSLRVLELGPDLVMEDFREAYHAILPALRLPDVNLATVKVKIFEPQTDRLADPHATGVHQLAGKTTDRVKSREQSGDFILGEHSRKILAPLGPKCFDARKFNFEDVLVDVKDCRQGLVLRSRRYVFFNGQICQKLRHLIRPKLLRTYPLPVRLSMESEERFEVQPVALKRAACMMVPLDHLSQLLFDFHGISPSPSVITCAGAE